MEIIRTSKKKNRVYQTVLFQISSLADIAQKEAKGEAPAFFDDAYLLIYVLEGSGKITVDMDCFEIQKNTIYYAKPGQVVRLYMGNDANGYVASFAKEFLAFPEETPSELFQSPFFSQSQSHPFVPVSNEALAPMIGIAENLLQEYQNFLDLRSEILRGYLKILLIYVCRQCRAEGQSGFRSRRAALTKLFFAKLETHFTTKKLVKEYAEMLSVSPSYLNDAVREVSGFTASHHIQQRIVLEAKRKALYEGFSLKETAYNLGFWDPSHFSKYFKNSSGINFTDFKKSAMTSW